jgi:hypothetical protein
MLVSIGSAWSWIGARPSATSKAESNIAHVVRQTLSRFLGKVFMNGTFVPMNMPKQLYIAA